MFMGCDLPIQLLLKSLSMAYCRSVDPFTMYWFTSRTMLDASGIIVLTVFNACNTSYVLPYRYNWDNSLDNNYKALVTLVTFYQEFILNSWFYHMAIYVRDNKSVLLSYCSHAYNNCIAILIQNVI